MLTDRRVLVTGAANGIGNAIAESLHRDGCRVAIGDIQGAAAAAARLGGPTIGIDLDVSDPRQAESAVERCAAEFGGLDVLVNNAGLFTTISRGNFWDLDPAEWNRVFAVNLGGVFAMARAAWPLPRESPAGRIINITSATVFSAPPMMLHYVATKGAVTTMTRSMARELGEYGITVNAIAPGYTLSAGEIARKGQTDSPSAARARSARALKRDQLPEDLVGAVRFFAGADSGFVTGQTLVVDGGAVMR